MQIHTYITLLTKVHLVKALLNSLYETQDSKSLKLYEQSPLFIGVGEDS